MNQKTIVSEIKSLHARLDKLTDIVLQNTKNYRPPKHVGAIKAIQLIVSKEFGVPPSAMTSPRRFEAYAWARQVAMYFVYKLTDATSVSTGKLFGNRDHGTVLAGCKHVKNRMDVEPDMRELIDNLETRIKAFLEGK